MRSLSVLTFLLALPFCGGCASSGTSLEPGETAYSSFSGDFEAVEAAPYRKAVRATMEAMEKLDLKPMERDRDGFRTFIVGESVFGNISQSHEIRVWVTRVTEESTHIEIRIVGRRDEGRIRTIHEGIRKALAPSA